jgi:hypothetical protein
MQNKCEMEYLPKFVSSLGLIFNIIGVLEDRVRGSIGGGVGAGVDGVPVWCRRRCRQKGRAA